MLPSRRAVASSSAWAACISPTANAALLRHYATPVDGPIEGDGVVREDRPLIRKIPRGRAFDSSLIRKHSVGGQRDNRDGRYDQSRVQRHEQSKDKYAKDRGQRQYQTSSPKPERVQRRCLDTHGRACSVLTSSPPSTPLSDLLAQIPRLEAANIRKTFGLFVFLVTPTYASSARQQKDLVEETIRRIYPGASGVHGLHSLVAVVDRLPRPTASPAEDGGSEGLAFMFTDDTVDAPGIFDEETSTATVIRDVASSFQVRRSLTFNIVSERAYESTGDRDDTSDSCSYSAQVPLANTIFQNGLPSTLIHTRYDKTGTNLHRTSSRYLKNQTLRVPFFAADEKGSNLSLTAPLVPLTSARSVVACMGNIVRRLSVRPHSPTKPSEEDTILASHELEESVQAYFKARGIPPRTVSVWALVVPKEAFSAFSNSMVDVLHPSNLVQRWKNNTLNWVESVKHTPFSLMQHHARLHKVLSGGGGWGKKAGLLSLDPESSYNLDESSSQEGSFLAGLDLDLDNEKSALRDIVSPGDYIQFYISPTASGEDVVVKQDISDPTRTSQWRSADFGTIPSTIDTIPQVSSKADGVSASVQMHPNHFGALSEVGIALTITKHTARSLEQINQTKVDVPFGRFSLLSRGDSVSTPPGFGDAEQHKSKLESLWESFEDSGEPIKEEDETPPRLDTQSSKESYFVPVSRSADAKSSKGASSEDKTVLKSYLSAPAEGTEHRHSCSGGLDQVTYMLPGKRRTRKAQLKAHNSPNLEAPSLEPRGLFGPTNLQTQDDIPSDMRPTKFSTVKSRQDQRRNERLTAKRKPMKEAQQNQEPVGSISEGDVAAIGRVKEGGERTGNGMQSMVKEQIKRHTTGYATIEHDEADNLIDTIEPRLPKNRQRGSEEQIRYDAREKSRRLEEITATTDGYERATTGAIHTSTQEDFPRGPRIRMIKRPPNGAWNALTYSARRDVAELHSRRLMGSPVRRVEGKLIQKVRSDVEHSTRDPQSETLATRSYIREARKVRSERRDSSLHEKEMVLPAPAHGMQRQSRKEAEIEDSVRRLLGL